MASLSERWRERGPVFTPCTLKRPLCAAALTRPAVMDDLASPRPSAFPTDARDLNSRPTHSSEVPEHPGVLLTTGF